MAKFYGAIGYVEDQETAPDVHNQIPIERKCKGDLIQNFRRLENGLDVNDNIVLSNSISIVADAYAINHMHAIRYVKWRGTNWKVNTVDGSNPPRLKLSLGGVYNGPTAEEP